MTQTQTLFLELLRAGLWGHKADPTLFEKDVDWKAVINLAKEQTALLIVADGYLTLPAELQPRKEIQFMVESHRLRNSKAHLMLDKAIAEVCTLMNSEGIRTVLFKGEGLARNYINPMSRACGDIDLYVGKKNLEKAKTLLDNYGKTEGEDSHSEKHYHCKRNGIDIELHRIAESLDLPSKDAKYQEWTEKHLIESDNFETVSINGCEVNLPCAQFNVIYIFNHFFHHFQSSGVGIRQICDWAVYLHTHAGLYDWKTVEKDLEDFGLTPAWKVFAQIAVDYLGLDPSEMPLYRGPAGRRASKAMKMVFAYGNFGRTEAATRVPRPKGYLSGKLHSFLYATKNNFRLFPMFPLMTITHFIAFTINGVSVVFKDKFCRR